MSLDVTFIFTTTSTLWPGVRLQCPLGCPPPHKVAGCDLSGHVLDSMLAKLIPWETLQTLSHTFHLFKIVFSFSLMRLVIQIGRALWIFSVAQFYNR